MGRIVTPFGKIHIAIDGKDMLYDFTKLEATDICPDVAGRYKIVIRFVPDGKEHKIECTFPQEEYIKYEHSPESGERLECNAFYKGDSKLSIGIEADAGYIEGERESDFGYDYDSEYMDNGIAYIILPTTKTEQYVFGVCWLENLSDENDAQTWFGADPVMMA